MKKFLKITAAIAILLLLCYFGFFKYRQIQANNISIPDSTNALLKINVDELYKTIAVSYIKHPSQYSGADKKGIKEKVDDLNTGLKIPANIYIYSLKGKAKTTFFSTFEIADTLAFNRFIQKKSALPLIKKDRNFFQSKDSTFCVLFNKTTVALAYTPQKEQLKTVLQAILDKKNMVKLGDSQFNRLANLSDHISFQNTESFSKINFTDGKINFSNEFINQMIVPAAKPQHRTLNPESTIGMWLNAKFKSELPKKNQTETPSLLSKGSFFRFYKDYVDFEWTNTITQVDTVVGYEYNDDFERVEKKVLQDRKIPFISMNLTANDREVSDYLKSLGALDQSTGKISSSMIPLYQVYFKGSSGNIQLSTVKSTKPDLKRTSSDDFFYFKVDFKKLIKQTPMPLIADKLGTFSQLEIKAKSIEKDKIKLESELLFLNEDANALIQLLKAFRNGLQNQLNLKSALDISIHK
ncbi:hypothetical protein ASU31_11010 [Pedobacter ginsenosidimutans]|uniref:DUF4836 domain-containing protein n=1 Tax=Pedobacter ginsenosidimutans TaxID=687842 RepID=A0A0T5VQ90_9SPHI|nr:hypothetical protein [Pedobacter ginsenosidimutans]KRT16026.1 hypothetical protein ASU31_11010 [Pedobacter ginsenosidimutans]